MLQRQIMFKQLQEMQRKQQLQDLGDPRNQDYINQMSLLRQSSGPQFPPTVNGTTANDSQVLMFGNMQMMQHGGPNVLQGVPNGVVFSQSHSHPQFDLYGNPGPNSDKNLNEYSHLQGQGNRSANLLAKNNNSPLGMSPLQQSAFANSFNMPDQVFQEKNLFGQVPSQNYNSDILYSDQGVAQPDASLDPLEQKFLYNTDDNSWESSFSRNSKMGTGGLESTEENPSFLDGLPSLQNGSWSALMQSAVAETSSSETGIQEEWSGLSFQNPEPSSNENHPSNFILNSEKPQNNWVDRKSQNVSSPSSQPDNLFQNSNFACFQSEYSRASSQQSPARTTSLLVDYNSQLKHSSGGSQLIQTSVPSSNTSPGQYKENIEIENRSRNDFSGREVGDTLWLHGNPSNPVAGGIQKPFDQVNQLNMHGYSIESEKMVAPGNNLEHMSPLLTASSDLHGQNVTGHSENMLELLNKEEISNQQTRGMQLNSKVSTLSAGTSVASFADTPSVPQGFGFRMGPSDPGTPQSHSLFPSLSMGNSIATSLSSHNVNDYIKNQHPANFTAYTAAPQVNFQPSVTSAVSQHVGPTSWPDITTQHNVSSPKPYKLSSNLFRSPDSASSSLETSSGAPNEHEHNVQEFGAYSGKSEKENSLHDSSLGTHMHQQPSNLRYNEAPVRDIKAFGRSLNQNYSQLHQVHSPRNAETGFGKTFPFNYENVNYQQAIANARDLFMSGHKPPVKDQAKNELDAISHIGNEASNLTYQPQVSLQMAPSWFNHYGTTLNNGQVLPIYDPRAAAIRNLQENILMNQVNSAKATLIESKNLSSPSVLPSDVTYQNLAVSTKKKRKIVAFEMIPWHKEVNHEPLRVHNMSMAELEWALASNRREDEVVKNETETVENVVPVVRAKRRLVFTTQLMQQVFRPAPAVILFADANSNCDYVAYFGARLALGDACNLTHKLPPSNTDDMKPDELKTSKKTTTCDYSKVVEGLISRVQKLEGDLSRVEKSLSIVDIKVEAQELEKFATINRFAKFHIKAQSNTADPASSSIQQRSYPQKYVTGVPMPKIVPEGTECLSL